MVGVAFDGSFWLGSLQHPTLRLRQALRLDMTTDDENVILTWPEANSLYGYGDTLSAAVTDFRLSLAELYVSLISDDANGLGPDMRTLRDLLAANVRRIDLGD